MEPLKDGETICPVCNGNGEYTTVDVNENGIISQYNTCKKCLGHGKLDWVEVIVGKRNQYIWPISYLSHDQNFKANSFFKLGRNFDPKGDL